MVVPFLLGLLFSGFSFRGIQASLFYTHSIFEAGLGLTEPFLPLWSYFAHPSASPTLMLAEVERPSWLPGTLALQSFLLGFILLDRPWWGTPQDSCFCKVHQVLGQRPLLATCDFQIRVARKPNRRTSQNALTWAGLPVASFQLSWDYLLFCEVGSHLILRCLCSFKIYLGLCDGAH